MSAVAVYLLVGALLGMVVLANDPPDPAEAAWLGFWWPVYLAVAVCAIVVLVIVAFMSAAIALTFRVQKAWWDLLERFD